MSPKTVFISYRRETGSTFAQMIRQFLTGRGYDVFLDTDSVGPGEWASQILPEVPKRAHFLLLLTPRALDRCAVPEDWVRREFELAVRTNRNIVPVLEGALELTRVRSACPPAMSKVFDFQAFNLRHEAVDRDLEHLVTHFIPAHHAPKTSINCRDNEAFEAVQRLGPSRLPKGTGKFVGREQELARLDAAWSDPQIRVATVVAWGGVGKTSLLGNWVSQLAGRDFDGANFFDWSFYRQGATSEVGDPSSDFFLDAALRFFGDEAIADSARSSWDKGSRLSELVAKKRTLLVLDGLESLQHPPGSLGGELKDQGIAALLRGLAGRNLGLCVVTTRERVTDLESFRSTTAPEWKLGHLPTEAGVSLLQRLEVKGTLDELKDLAEHTRGHALTLNLVGCFLRDACGGDIRRRGEIDFSEVNESIQGGHAFRVMDAYERWFLSGGAVEKRQLAILRLLGLFDRPADPECLAALRREPAMAGLTTDLVDLSPTRWSLAISHLEKASLVVRDGDQLDTHPLIREHFARRVQEQSAEAWKQAQGRLFELLQARAEHWPNTVEGLQPLYQAVRHGCRAGRYGEAFANVLRSRIQRGNKSGGFFSTVKLGAFGLDLEAVACFFEQPWGRVSDQLAAFDQAFLLNQAAFCLRSLGRLQEAVEPLHAGLQKNVDQQDWERAASAASNLSWLMLIQGEIATAVENAEIAVKFADRSGDGFQRDARRTSLGNALHYAGRRREALACFVEAEHLQLTRLPEAPFLFSYQGFRYCDLLLAKVEWAAAGFEFTGDIRQLVERLQQIEKRALAALSLAKPNQWILSLGLDYLTLGRIHLFRAILFGEEFESAELALENSFKYLRRSGRRDFFPQALLARSWLRFTQGQPDAARADLDEAEMIATRGPMPLYLADIVLSRARFFHDLEALLEARLLIDKHSYGRRFDEVAALEASSETW